MSHGHATRSTLTYSRVIHLILLLLPMVWSSSSASARYALSRPSNSNGVLVKAPSRVTPMSWSCRSSSSASARRVRRWFRHFLNDACSANRASIANRTIWSSLSRTGEVFGATKLLRFCLSVGSRRTPSALAVLLTSKSSKSSSLTKALGENLNNDDICVLRTAVRANVDARQCA